MAENTDELLVRFHSLKGGNLQDVKRSFNELTLDMQSAKDLDHLITSIHPKNELEAILKTEILIRFGKYDALMELLKSGNSHLIGKVLKCWKFFELVFSQIDGKTLVDGIFPQVSYSTRMKIITKLSTNLKNEELADEFYLAIENKYGLFVANGLLPACSLDLIKTKVGEHKLYLTSRQLLKVVKREHEFLAYYFALLYQVNEGFDFSWKYPQVFKFIAKNNVRLFWELFQKYKFKVKLGRHLTSKLYESGKQLVARSDYEDRFFNLRIIYKILRGNEDDLRRFIVDLYPKKRDEFFLDSSDCCLKTLFNCLPKNKRYDVLNGCFKKAYGKDIHKIFNAIIPDHIIQVMPEAEREVWVDNKILHDDYDSYVYMYPTKKSIPLLMERIKYTSNNKRRSNFVSLMGKTCKFNCDTEAFLEVLKYVRQRHRNDNTALSNFMTNIHDWATIDKLSREHWAIIIELFNVCKRMPTSRLHYYDNILMTKYFEHLVANKQPYEEFLEMYCKHIKDSGSFFDGFYSWTNMQCKKLCLEYFAQLVSKMFTGNEDNDSMVGTVLFSMVYFNQKQKRKDKRIKISNFSNLVPLLRKQLTKTYHSDASSFLKHYVMYEYDEVCDDIFWSNYKRCNDLSVLVWFLKHKPDKILEHIDLILDPSNVQNMKCNLSLVFRLASLLTFTEIPQKIIDFALKSVTNENAVIAKFSVSALSFLVPEKTYLDTAKFFIPSPDGKIDFNNVTTETFVSTQEVVVNNLANLAHPALCLPTLLEFCVGDYMKYAYKPLHRIIYRTRESELGDFLDGLYKKAVSIRKYAVNFTALLRPKKIALDFLEAAGELEKNASLQKAIFKSTLAVFAANPNQEFWKLLKKNIKIINKKDKEAFDYLTILKRIPYNYQPEHIPMVYQILSANQDKEICGKKYDLLTAVRNEMVDELSLEFLRRAIEDTLLCPLSRRVTDFYLKSIFYTSGQKQEEILSIIFGILKNYVAENWTDFACGQIRTDVYNVVSNVCQKAIKLKQSNFLVEKFMTNWTGVVNESMLLEEYLLLQLTNSYLQCNNNSSLDEFGKSVGQIFNDWVGLHGPMILPVFVEVLNDFLDYFISLSADDQKQFGFIEGLFRANEEVFILVLGLHVMFARLTWEYISSRYGWVLEKLRDNKSSVVRVHLRQRLRKVWEE